MLHTNATELAWCQQPAAYICTLLQRLLKQSQSPTYQTTDTVFANMPRACAKAHGRAMAQLCPRQNAWGQ